MPGLTASDESAAMADEEALARIGQEARGLVERGRVEVALQMLTPHLLEVLGGAAGGVALPERLCLSAARHAQEIAHWTADVVWLDYVVQLHLACGRIMDRTMILALQRSARWLGRLDAELLGRYVRKLASRAGDFDAEERARFALLQRFSEAALASSDQRCPPA